MSLSAPPTSIVVVTRPRGGLFAAVRRMPVWLRALVRRDRGARGAVSGATRVLASGASESDRSPEREALVGRLSERGAIVVVAADGVPVAEVAAGEIASLLRGLRDEPELAFDGLHDLTIVDRLPESPRFEVVYGLCASGTGARIRVRTRIEADPGAPAVLDSLCSIWRSADWLEREASDLFGVRFRGHPGLLPILLPPGFEGAPLRRDFAAASAPAADTCDAPVDSAREREGERL